MAGGSLAAVAVFVCVRHRMNMVIAGVNLLGVLMVYGRLGRRVCGREGLAQTVHVCLWRSSATRRVHKR